MKRIIILLLAVVSIGTLWAEEPSYVTIENVSYRPTATDSYQKERCVFDIYHPTSKGFATMIWFHGGGLTKGNKKIPDTLKENGIAIVAANYRLVPKVGVAECIDDAAAAAAWVVEHIAEYGGDPTKIFVAGHSAGGYLTSMICLDKRWLTPYGIDPDTTFVAAIPYSGQTITHFEHRRTKGLSKQQPLIDDMAPLAYVRADCVPMLILSGDRELEMVGRYEENAYFWRMMKVVGHKDVQLCEFDGFNHSKMPQAGHYVALRYIKKRIRK